MNTQSTPKIIAVNKNNNKKLHIIQEESNLKYLKKNLQKLN